MVAWGIDIIWDNLGIMDIIWERYNLAISEHQKTPECLLTNQKTLEMLLCVERDRFSKRNYSRTMKSLNVSQGTNNTKKSAGCLACLLIHSFTHLRICQTLMMTYTV